mmetsp:Transcript_30855/g.59555  ORF Transcript_30855/g.59555 Transcript_30855/m.59555 type:complete len:80 (+) Transcript_30855:129-368(+)
MRHQRINEQQLCWDRSKPDDKAVDKNNTGLGVGAPQPLCSKGPTTWSHGSRLKPEALTVIADARAWEPTFKRLQVTELL